MAERSRAPRRLHRIRFWDKPELREPIATRHPQFLPTWDRYRYLHQRADTGRPERLAELQRALELSLDAGQIAWLANGGDETAPVAAG